MAINDLPGLCQQLGVSLDETVSERDLDDLLWVFGCESSAVRLLFFFSCILSMTDCLSMAQYSFLFLRVLIRS